ncbi:MAG: ATPase [Gammaproteobacteria bacterium]|nr:ATPase [Gammaproteobacteria bacterium]
MKFTVEQFRNWEHKSITLLGMSGVGKTWLANMLRRSNWFHFSGDYRIGSRYLDEPILDNIKHQAMAIPFLRDLLRNDSIHIVNNLTVDNLQPVSSFLGKLGNPELGGLGLQEFKYRQKLHLQAEIATMRDVPDFIEKAHDIYGYNHFLNDAGGSVCELDDPDTLEILSEHTLFLYIKATEQDEKELIRRAELDPKPLYYREEFLDEQLSIYMEEKQLPYVAMIEPDDFVRWVFPRLFSSRIPRYDAIAQRYGYTVTTQELWQIQNEAEFLELIESAIDKQQ